MSQSIYRTVLDEEFPEEIRLTAGGQELVYQKQTFPSSGDGPGSPEEARGLRYGENPGQKAALYRLIQGRLEFGGVRYSSPLTAMVSAAAAPEILTGTRKHPSMTNFTDMDAALNILQNLERPAAVIIKHNNPSGAAQASSLAEAFTKAYRGDQLSAFGGVVVFNRPVTRDIPPLLDEFFVEVAAAPDFEEGTAALLSRKPGLRLFRLPNLDRLNTLPRTLHIKTLLDGGLIVHQSLVSSIRTREDFQPACASHKGQAYESVRTPTEAEYRDLIFGWQVIAAVSSNSAVIVKDEATAAVAGGQQSRLGVVQLAVSKAYQNYCQLRAQELHQVPFWQMARTSDPALVQALELEARNCHAGLCGASLVSDGFFPFRDAVMEALSEGITAIAHPGGSIQDWDSIEACNQHRPPAAMVFTGQRAFKH